MNKVAFENVFVDDTRNVAKIPRNEYSQYGIIPIVDQGKEYISGYSNDEQKNKITGERIIFGDHTRIIKYVNFNCYIGADGVKVLKIKKENINYKYMYYYLKNSYIPNTGYNRHYKWLKELIFNIPLKEEQNKIVSELDKVQEIIDLREKQIQRLDELIKSQFVEMFGEPFDKGKWIVNRLGDITVSISDGSNVDTKYYENNGEVLFLRIQNVWHNEFRLDDSVYITDEVNRLYKDTSLLNGDILISKIGRSYTKDSSLGRVSIYRGKDNKANYSNNVMRIRLKDDYNSEFVNVLLNLDDYQKFIKRESKGGTDKRALSKRIIESFPIINPPMDLQIKFIEFVKLIDKQKFEIQKSLEEVEKLQESLMNKYFG